MAVDRDVGDSFVGLVQAVKFLSLVHCFRGRITAAAKDFDFPSRSFQSRWAAIISRLPRRHQTSACIVVVRILPSELSQSVWVLLYALCCLSGSQVQRNIWLSHLAGEDPVPSWRARSCELFCGRNLTSFVRLLAPLGRSTSPLFFF